MSLNELKSLLTITHENGTETKVDDLDLGRRVRELRKERDWTLERAAKEAGLARSTLSKIENDQMSPTFDLMKKLALGLGIDLPQLFVPSSNAQVSGRMDVTKAGEGKTLVTPTYEHELLSAGLTKKSMLPYRTAIRARSVEEFDGWVRHDGEEFVYVLTGKITFYSEYYEPVEMARGDSAYYDASMGHNLISTSAEDATVLWVTSLG